jgi:hypothetical protein
VAPGLPVTSSPNLLVDLRVKFSIQPKETQGAGGALTEKRPLTEGSKSVGTRWTRSTGAK